MMLRKIDLNLLLLLDTLIEERNVTRTAKRLAMTQPALSNALNRLRDMLDDPLFERTSDGMEPTPYALSIAKPVRRILHELDDLFTQKVAFDPLESIRCFTVMIESHLTGLAQPLSSRLGQLAPNASLRIQHFTYRENKPLIDPEADVLIAFNFLSFPGTRHVPLFTDDLVAVVRRDHPNAKPGITLEEYAGEFEHFLVECSVGGMGQEYFDGMLGNLGIKRQVRLRMPLMQDQLQLIASSDFVALWPRRFAGKVNVLFGNPFALMELPETFRDMTKSEIDLFWEDRYTNDPSNAWLRKLIMEVCLDEYGQPPASMLQRQGE